jgi:hypothetical protein
VCATGAWSAGDEIVAGAAFGLLATEVEAAPESVFAFGRLSTVEVAPESVFGFGLLATRVGVAPEALLVPDSTGVVGVGGAGSGGVVVVTGGVEEVSTLTVATGVETVPEPPLEVGSEVLRSTAVSAWATGVETSAEALAPPEPAVTTAAVLVSGVEVSVDAWAPLEVSTFALVSVLATGVSTVVLELALGALEPVFESVAVVLTLTGAVSAPALTVVVVAGEEMPVSTVTCVEGSDGGVVERAAAVPAYASVASTARTATAAIRRALQPIFGLSSNVDLP